MRKAILQFEDPVSLLDFVIESKGANVEANSCELTLTGNYSDDDILLACSKYKAVLLELNPEAYVYGVLVD